MNTDQEALLFPCESVSIRGLLSASGNHPPSSGV